MSRTEKKCLVASVGLHSFLLLLLVVGSAFFVSTEKKRADNFPRLRVIPQSVVDDAMAGGGGNPNIAPNDGQQHGNTTIPKPPEPPRPPVKPPEVVKPPQRTEVRQPEHHVETPPKPPKAVAKPVREAVKPNSPPKVAKTEPLVLKPVVRNNSDKEKAKADAEAREQEAAARRTVGQLSRITEGLRSGFSQGTVVQASGPGGEAFVDYATFVKSAYEDAWIVMDDLLDEDSTAKVTVTIARSGDVISARIERRSGNAVLDKSVQSAIHKVRFVRAFPPGARVEQRTFTINFNLKAKRQAG